MKIYLKLQNATSSLKLWPSEGGESKFPLLKSQHHFCLHGDEFVGIWVPTAGTSVVSQRRSRAHLPRAALGKEAMPVEAISVMAQPERGGEGAGPRLTGSS